MMGDGEFEGKYHIHKLEPDDLVESFDCGDPNLNDFILKMASDYRTSHLAVTYVIAKTEDPDRVLGFCSLAHDNVSMNDFESTTALNRFRRRHKIHYNKPLTTFPAIKVCRLGVDRSAMNRGFGTLLLDYVKSSFLLDPKAGCRFVIVDAYTAAIPFYEKNGFCPLGNFRGTNKSTRPLYFDLADLDISPQG